MRDLIEEDATMRPFKPANRSRATRMFAARSKASARGFVVATLPAQQLPRQIIFESHLEQKVLLVLLSLQDIWDQPKRVRYMR